MLEADSPPLSFKVTSTWVCVCMLARVSVHYSHSCLKIDIAYD